MPQAWVGLNVQTPVNPLNNGGADKTAATITRVHLNGTVPAEGPNGGIVVDLRVFPNSTSEPYFLPDVELVDYETWARDTGLGVGLGAWPLDG